MNMKKKTIAFVACLFILVGLCVVYILSELYTESEIPEPVATDALKFKEEYESVNDKDNGKGNKYRNLTIAEDNPFIYITAEELVKKIDKKETFAVYFGFKTCPWCRSMVTSLIESAKENNVQEIYYVDVLNIRDTYSLDENNKAIKTNEGTQGYNDLLDRLGNVLSDYAPLTYTVKKKNKEKEVKVKIPEKRIYAPNVVVVKDGVAIDMTEGISSSLTDPYMNLSKEMIEDSKKQISDVLACLPCTSACSVGKKNC